MKEFSTLFNRLDRSTKTNEKLEALVDFFQTAAPDDAAWALFYLTGRRLPRAISTADLRSWASAFSGTPRWLLDECYATVGDLAETIALLLPPPDRPRDWPLSELIRDRVMPLRDLPPDERRALVEQTWRELDGTDRFLFHKLLTGSFRVGVSRGLVERALAAVARIDPAEMAGRLAGEWEPSAEQFKRFLEPSASGAGRGLQPYPFFLAHALDVPPDSLGDPREWLAEWKWDGIRAQLIRRKGTCAIWTRGDEGVTMRYPEIVRASASIPDGHVLDGEVLAWRDERPLSFAVLQQRIGRERLTAAILREAPVVFLAYDLLEKDGEDWRPRPLRERRRALEELVASIDPNVPLKLSPALPFDRWEQLSSYRAEARLRGVEGIMLKRLDSPYGTGRERGPWWKWKVEPYTIDAVLLYAQAGHGRRAGLHTDYTLGVWRGDTLVPVAKAYSGLTDQELETIDRWIRRNTLEKRGPVRIVKPELVFEIAFEGIQPSNRHKSGLALRFPRISRWRTDKRPQEADRYESLEKLLQAVPRPNSKPEDQNLLLFPL